MLNGRETLPDKLRVRVGGYAANLDVKKGKPKADDAVLEQILINKGIWSKGVHISVDHDAIEQLYLNGELTDNDFRRAGIENKVTLALSIEMVEGEEELLPDV